MPLILFSYTSNKKIQDFYETDTKNNYMSSANVIAGYVEGKEALIDADKLKLLNSSIKEKAKEGKYRIIIVDTNSTVICDSKNGNAVGKIMVVPEIINALSSKDDVNIHQSEQTLYASASLVDENTDIIGAVLVVAPIEDIYLLLTKLQHAVYFYMIIFSLIIIIVVSLMSNFFLSPFKKILKTLEKMAEGHLDQRIKIRRNDEFSDIANAFNDMADKLEEVEVTRDQFVSNVSHELKTPLSSIKVLSESILLEESVPTEMYVEFLQDINSEVDRMTNIVNDLLTLVKLDQIEIALNKEMIRIDVLVSQITKRLSSLANHKGIELTCEVLKEVEIFADEMKLTLAISNLIENAIKYTEEGRVSVTVSADHQNIFITVEDTGIGISEDEQDKIFRRFYRVDKTRDRETGGTGLGLAITHSTVLLHNGSIRVNSEEGTGSVFTVRLPINTIS